MSQAFVRWGGFYPYNYTNGDSSFLTTTSGHADLIQDSAVSPESDPKASEEEKRQWRARQATIAMSTALYRHRSLLRTVGSASHGMVKVGESWKIKEHVLPSELPSNDDSPEATSEGDAPRQPEITLDSASDEVENVMLDIKPHDNTTPKPQKTRLSRRREARKALQSIESDSIPKPDGAVDEVNSKRSQGEIEDGDLAAQDKFRERMWGFVRQVWR